jgi:phosphohistidine swiveling domain-containing protein
MQQRFIVVARDFHSPLIRNEVWVAFGRTWPELFDMPEPYVGISSQEDSITYVVDGKTWSVAKDTFQQRVQSNPAVLTDVIGRSEEWGQEMNLFTEKAKEENLTTWSGDKMWEFYQEFARLQTRQYAVGILLPLIDIAGVSFLEDFLRKYSQQHLTSEEASEAFAVFTTPTKNSFALDQEDALLGLMRTILSDPTVRRIFAERKANEIMALLYKNYPEVAEQIQQHTDKYSWVYYVYVGPAFTSVHFIQFIQDYLKKNVDPSAELERRRSERERLLQKRAELLEQLNPNAIDKGLIEAVSEFVWAKPRRKDYQSKSYYHMEVFFKELGRRAQMSLRHARSATQKQIGQILQGEAINRTALDEQYKRHYAFTTEAGTQIAVGSEADELFALAKSEDVEVTDTSALRGSTAYAGKTQGKVKIINRPEDMQKMEDGDILVSVATTPSIVPAMKQAAAIVSDEGGLTCHAAIVSRELRIPCVVGTKVATRVLKDGDLVEVDAEKGIVRKL